MNRNIGILGDSIAKGVLFDAQRNRYVIAKENLGKQITQEFGCSVTNLSTFGCTVTDGLAVHKIAQTANVKLIDIHSAFLERRDYGAYLRDDGIHPNEKGHSMMSKIVLQQI